MVKIAFALVALVALHVCSSNKLFILNKELIEDLHSLHGLYQGQKLNVTAGFSLYIPKQYMLRNASVCVDVFTKYLMHLLDNVTVHEGSKYILKQLKDNLKDLKYVHKQEDHEHCMTNDSRRTRGPFFPYINYLKKLNTKRR